MRFLIALLLTLSIPGSIVAQARDETAEREIEQAEHAYNAARLANDIAALNRMTGGRVFRHQCPRDIARMGNERTQPVNMTPSGLMEKSRASKYARSSLRRHRSLDIRTTCGCAPERRQRGRGKCYYDACMGSGGRSLATRPNALHVPVGRWKVG